MAAMEVSLAASSSHFLTSDEASGKGRICSVTRTLRQKFDTAALCLSLPETRLLAISATRPPWKEPS